MLPTIKLIGGPYEGLLIKATHPWPRSSITVEGPDGGQAAYHLQEASESAQIVLAEFYRTLPTDDVD
jgi:hypothetical protein